MPDVSYILIPEPDWSASDLIRYITDQMARLGIEWESAPSKEKSIIEAFVRRFDIETAISIAKYVYEVLGGLWRSRPVTFWNFTISNDETFGSQIAAILQRT